MVKDRIGFSYTIDVSSMRRSGGFRLYWNEDKVNFDLISLSSHHNSVKSPKEGEYGALLVLMGGRMLRINTELRNLIQHLCDGVDVPIFVRR